MKTASTNEQVGVLSAMEALAQAAWWEWGKRVGMENPGEWCRVSGRTRNSWRRTSRYALQGVVAALLWPPVPGPRIGPRFEPSAPGCCDLYGTPHEACRYAS